MVASRAAPRQEQRVGAAVRRIQPSRQVDSSARNVSAQPHVLQRAEQHDRALDHVGKRYQMLHRHEAAVPVCVAHLVVESLGRAAERVLDVPVAVRGELLEHCLPQDGIQRLISDQRARHRVEEAVAVALHADGHQRRHRAAVLCIHSREQLCQVLLRVGVAHAAGGAPQRKGLGARSTQRCLRELRLHGAGPRRPKLISPNNAGARRTHPTAGKGKSKRSTGSGELPCSAATQRPSAVHLWHMAASGAAGVQGRVRAASAAHGAGRARRRWEGAPRLFERHVTSHDLLLGTCSIAHDAREGPFSNESSHAWKHASGAR